MTYTTPTYAAPPPQQASPSQQVHAAPGGGILRPFLQQLFAPGLVVFRVDPTAVRQVIEDIRREIKPEELLKKETPMKDITEDLSILADMSTKLAQILSRHLRELPGLIIDPTTAPREVKARLVAVATEAKAFYDMLVGERMSKMMKLLEEIQRGSNIPEEKFLEVFKLSDVVKVLTMVLTAFVKACYYLRLSLYLNMPAMNRSPLFNLLSGFDIIRRQS